MDYQMRSTKRTCPPKPPTPPRLPSSYDHFMQNKPNFPDAKMNVTTSLTKDYQNIRPRSPLQNKPNLQSHHASNGNPLPPNNPADYKNAKQNQFPKSSNERNYCHDKGLSKYSLLADPCKTNPICNPTTPAMESTAPQPPSQLQKMQNKPNFQKAKINLTSYRNMDYENYAFENHEKTNPISNPPANTGCTRNGHRRIFMSHFGRLSALNSVTDRIGLMMENNEK